MERVGDHLILPERGRKRTAGGHEVKWLRALEGPLRSAEFAL